MSLSCQGMMLIRAVRKKMGGGQLNGWKCLERTNLILETIIDSEEEKSINPKIHLNETINCYLVNL